MPVYQEGHNNLIPLYLNLPATSDGEYQLYFADSKDDINIWTISRPDRADRSSDEVDASDNPLYIEGTSAGTATITLQFVPDDTSGTFPAGG